MVQEFGYTTFLSSYLHADTDIFLDSFLFLIVVSLKSTHLLSFALYLNNSTSTCCINLSLPLAVI